LLDGSAAVPTSWPLARRFADGQEYELARSERRATDRRREEGGAERGSDPIIGSVFVEVGIEFLQGGRLPFLEHQPP
jgi:hypothetical protein